MTSRDVVELSRDCPATTVPHGERVILDGGGQVQVVQRLGASITVRTQMGALLRIDGADADALGLDVGDTDERQADGPFEMSHVVDALQTIYDPEIPVSIVELGLVYRCDEIVLPDGTRRIEIDMSMTAPGCGMGDILRADALRAVKLVPGVDEVEVTLVFSPPWTIARMSDAARLQLGLL
jgi:probable FeS assembly SUF system protein SufT